MILPRHLQPGHRVAAISLSWGGPGAIPHRYEIGKRQLEDVFGVEVVETEHARSDPDWVARHPEARARDLMAAFADESIHAIVSTIGGDESVRILPHLDLEVITANPKIFMGFSDTTITHLACHRAGLTSFYGPSFMAGFAENGGMYPYMVESLRRTLFEPGPVGAIAPHAGGWTSERTEWADATQQSTPRSLNDHEPWKFLQGDGIHRGPLLGGCMEVLEFLKGTDYWPPLERWRGSILFFETSEEAPPPMMVERWLRNYGSQGILQEAAGLIFGRPGGEIPASGFDGHDEVLLKVVRDELGLGELAIITRMDFGHTDPMFVIPYGVEAEMDMSRKRFSIVGAATV